MKGVTGATGLAPEAVLCSNVVSSVKHEIVDSCAKIFGRRKALDTNDTKLDSLLSSPVVSSKIQLVCDEGLSSPYFVDAGEASSGNAILRVDTAPLTLVPNAPLSRVFLLFRMLRLTHMYVVDKGSLVGVITRSKLLDIGLNDSGVEEGFLDYFFRTRSG